MASWLDSLKPLPVEGLRSVFPEAADVTRSAKAAISGNRLHRRTVRRRRTLDMRRAGNAAEHIGTLPAADESLHGVMGGSYDGWHLVGAVLDLAGGATIQRLTVATLGFNRSNSQSLFAMLDADKIGAVDFIVSTYFRALDKDIYADLHAGLTHRGHRCCVVRSHAKILLFEMSDGRTYTVESSANLRSCKNTEQWVMTADADLLAFHRSWILELIEQATE